MPRNRALDVPKVVPEGLTLPTESSAKGSDPSLVDWLRVILDGWQALVISVVVGILLGVVATVMQSTVYRATGSVVVSPAQFLDPNSAAQLPTLTDTVQRLAGTTAILAPTASRYVDRAPDQVTRARRREVATPDWVSRHIQVAQLGDSSIIEISGVGGSQRDAVDLTRATVTTLARVVNKLEGPARATGAGRANGGIAIKVFTLARERGQVSPTPARNLVLGLNLGLIVGIVAALVLGMRRNRLRRPADVAGMLGVPLLGVVDLADHSLDEDPGILQAANALERRWGQGAHAVVLVTGTLDPRSLSVVSSFLVRALTNLGVDAAFVETAHAASTESAEDVLVGIQGGRAKPIASNRWSFDELTSPDRLVITAGPGLHEPFELARLAHQADHVLLVAHSGVTRGELASARMLEPKIAGALVLA